MRKGICKQFIAVMLSIAMAVTAFPSVAVTADTASIPIDSVVRSDLAAEDNTTEEPYEICELKEKRNQNTKHFLMSDGSIKACVYSDRVHYLENNIYNDIDNTLVEDESGKYYTNNKNSVKVKLPQDFNDNYVEYSNDSGYVKFKLLGSANKKIKKITDTKSKNKVKDITQPQKLNSAAIFKSVKADVDIRYDVSGNKLKETVILHKKTKNSFIFDIKTSSANAVLNEDNSVSFFDESGAELYIIDSPYMADSACVCSRDITVNLIPTADGYNLTYSPSYEWLSDKDRKYPVYLDPTISDVLDDQYSSFDDTYISSGASAANNYSFSHYVNVGTFSNNNQTEIRRGLAYFELPGEIAESDIVVSAVLHFGLVSGTHNNYVQINLHELTSPFSNLDVTWNNQPSYNAERVIDYSANRTKNTYNYDDGSVAYTEEYDAYDITYLARKWQRGHANYGLLFKLADESLPAGNNVQYYSQDRYYDWYSNYLTPLMSNFSKWLIINYRSSVGLEDYWSYSTQDMGISGTGYVNNYTGNLTYLHNDASIGSNLISVNATHVYNSELSGNFNLNSYYTPSVRGKYGNGWRLNLVEKIIDFSDDADFTFDYIYTDGDGTEYYFYQTEDGTVKDEDGLGYTLAAVNETVDSGTVSIKYQITTKDGTVMKFDSAGYLRRIIDTSNNTLSLNYTIGTAQQGRYLTSAATSSGKSITFSYTYDGDYMYLSSITDNAGRVTEYYYTDYNLTQIQYPDNTSAYFEYDRGKLIRVSPPCSQSINYTYYLKNPLAPAQSKYGRIHTVYNSAYDSGSKVIGNVDTYVYSSAQTVITDSRNRSVTYQFDTFGRLISAVDDENNTFSTQYNANKHTSSEIFKNNKPQTSSGTVVSYADICPPLAVRTVVGNQTHILKDKFAVSILKEMPAEVALEILHRNRAQKYTNSNIQTVFDDYRYIYSFVCDQSLFDELIANRECLLIIPESLIGVISFDQNTINVRIDSGH